MNLVWLCLGSMLLAAVAAFLNRSSVENSSSSTKGNWTTRGLSAFLAMGLALAGAVLLVQGFEPPLGAGLAIFGPLLATLSVWGGDLLWNERRKWLWMLAGSSILLVLLSVVLNLTLSSVVVMGLAGLWAGGTTLLSQNSVARGRLLQLRERVTAWQFLLALAVLIRIPVPLWPEGFPLIGTVQTCLITLAALVWGGSIIGARVFLLATVAFSLGLIVEILGSRSGIPFGVYSYAGAPAPTLLGVPLLVPLGWFAMVLSAHVLAQGRPLLTGLGVVAWDLGLEALMPQQGYWTWTDPNPLWYGAPIQNYLAWFGVGAAISALYRKWGPELHARAGLGWAFRLEALFIPAGLALFDLWPAAVVCGIAMNTFAWHDVLFRRSSARVLE